MSEIKTKIRTYNDVIDLFGEEKAADMLSEALDWSTIDPKNDNHEIFPNDAVCPSTLTNCFGCVAPSHISSCLTDWKIFLYVAA